MATDNRKIEKLLDQMKDTQSTELATQLTEALAESHVYVPAIMPRDTKPEVLRKMMENKNPNIYIICGKARSGKDSVAKIIKENKQNSTILSITKPLKDYAQIITDWDGSDNNKPRDLLQQLGIELIKNKIDNKFLIKRIIEDIKILSYYKNNIIITGIRLKEEIEDIKNNFSNVIVIKVVRPNHDNGLSIEQKKHITETNLDDYTPKYVIINEEKENLNDAVIKMLEEVEYE